MISKELELDNQTIVLQQILNPTLSSSIKDQETLRRLLRKEMAFNPQEDYVQATALGLNFLNSNKKVVASIWQHKVSHGGRGEPYEFLPFNSIPEEYSSVLHECRTAGFGKPVEHEGYTYKVISGGLMRRQTKWQILKIFLKEVEK